MFDGNLNTKCNSAHSFILLLWKQENKKIKKKAHTINSEQVDLDWEIDVLTSK